MLVSLLSVSTFYSSIVLIICIIDRNCDYDGSVEDTRNHHHNRIDDYNDDNNGKDLCNINDNIKLTKARVIIQRIVITIMTIKVIT